jgi:hypothetical protein
MAISSFSAASSGAVGGTNNFVLKTTDEKTYVLDRTYTSGRYSLSFLDSDTTFDIYAIAEDGTYAGYTSSTTLEVSADFAEIVVLGAGSGTRISFTHLGVLTEAFTSGDVATAGAFASSLVTSSLPSVDDTTVVNGGNFAADVQVSFIDQSAVETAAKTIVRSSSTQLIVTRPDAFSPDDSPYTVKVVNPGIPVPAGTNAHLMSNSVTAGTNPVWTTGTVVPYNVGGATNYTFLATDTEATDIDYSIVSGTLPAGLTLDGETGVISGTFSGSASEGDVTAVTIRAIDTGGNFLDKAFDFTANVAPTWTTAAGAINDPGPDTAYSFQFVASTGAVGGALTYTLQSGALLPGHTLSSTGLISGTSTGVSGDTAAFTIRTTDEGGLFADRSFTALVAAPIVEGFFLGAESLDANTDFIAQSLEVNQGYTSASMWATESSNYNNKGAIVQIRDAVGTQLRPHFIRRTSGTSQNSRMAAIVANPSSGDYLLTGTTDAGSNSEADIVIARVGTTGSATIYQYQHGNIGGTNSDRFEPHTIHSIEHNGVRKHVSLGDYTSGFRASFMHVVNDDGSDSLNSRVWRENTPNNAYSGHKGSCWNQTTEKMYVLTNGWNGERTIWVLDGDCNFQDYWSYGTNSGMETMTIDPANGNLFLGGDSGNLGRTDSNGNVQSSTTLQFEGVGQTIRSMRVIGDNLFVQTTGPNESYVAALNKTTFSVIWAKKLSPGSYQGARGQTMGNDPTKIAINLKPFTNRAAQFLMPMDGVGIASSYSAGATTVNVTSVTATHTGSGTLAMTAYSGLTTNVGSSAGISSRTPAMSADNSPDLTYTYTAI